MRSEKRKRLVSPIVAELRRAIVLVERKHRQKLDRTHAEVAQIGNFLDQPREGSALARCDARARVPGEPAHVHFVEDGLGEGTPDRGVTLPVIAGGIDHDAPERGRDVVARPSCCLARSRRRASDALAIRIEQHLARVETQTPFRIERPRDAVGIELSGRNAWNEGVPVVIGPVGARVEIDHPRRRRGIRAVEQQQLSRPAAFGEQAEIRAGAVERRAQRKAPAGMLDRMARHGAKSFASNSLSIHSHAT